MHCNFRAHGDNVLADLSRHRGCPRRSAIEVEQSTTGDVVASVVERLSAAPDIQQFVPMVTMKRVPAGLLRRDAKRHQVAHH